MSSRRRQWLLMGIALAVLAAIAGLYLRFAPRQTPAGQLPLETLGRSNVEQLRQTFNAAAAHPRLIAFLSPT